jgi:hypothetical protein
MVIKTMEQEKVSPITKHQKDKNNCNDISSNDTPEHYFLYKSMRQRANQYICEQCDYSTCKKSSYDRHLSSKKHIEKVSENKKTHFCKICDYTTSIKSNYEKHLSSKKHIQNSASSLKDQKSMFMCNICDYTTCIKYNYQRHSKTHKQSQYISSNKTNVIIDNENNGQLYSSIMDEIKNMMLEQTTKITEEQAKISQEQTKMNQMITEIANKPISNNTNINNNNNHNHNQHFNMNMFLNETCKDAMNLSDFMKNLTVTMEDMEITGQLGFVKGMTRIIVNNLNALDVCKRPIHCSDAKRETLYVKNNGVWEKETDDKQFTKELIRRVRHLSDIQLSKWRYLPKNKGYERYDHHKNTEFLTLVYEIHQFREEEIDKLIRNIIRHVVIDKSLYLK